MSMNYFVIPGLKTKEPLQPVTDDIKRRVIIEAVASHYKTSFEKMRLKSRKREIVEPRQVSMFLLKEKTDMLVAQIGLVFNRDHTTVIHSCRTIRNLTETGHNIAIEINIIRGLVTEKLLAARRYSIN